MRQFGTETEQKWSRGVNLWLHTSLYQIVHKKTFSLLLLLGWSCRWVPSSRNSILLYVVDVNTYHSLSMQKILSMLWPCWECHLFDNRSTNSSHSLQKRGDCCLNQSGRLLILVKEKWGESSALADGKTSPLIWAVPIFVVFRILSHCTVPTNWMQEMFRFLKTSKL